MTSSLLSQLWMSLTAFFESASGCRLHMDPASQKFKFLPLGNWRKSIQKQDLPAASCQYNALSFNLDMICDQL